MKMHYDKAEGGRSTVIVPDGGWTPARIVGMDNVTGEPVTARWNAVTSRWVEVEPAVLPAVQTLPEGLVEAIVTALEEEGIQSIYIGTIAEKVAQAAYSFCPTAP